MDPEKDKLFDTIQRFLAQELIQTNNSMEVVLVDTVIDAFYESRAQLLADSPDISRFLYPKFVQSMCIWTNHDETEERLEDMASELDAQPLSENLLYFQKFVEIGLKEITKPSNYVESMNKFRYSLRALEECEDVDWSEAYVFLFSDLEIFRMVDPYAFQDLIFEIWEKIKANIKQNQVSRPIKLFAVLTLAKLCGNYRNRLVTVQYSYSGFSTQDFYFTTQRAHYPRDGRKNLDLFF